MTLELNLKERSECTCLHWENTLGHRFIVAGFANGVVGIWDLGTKSPLLLKEETIYPVWSFYSHSGIVTGESFICLYSKCIHRSYDCLFFFDLLVLSRVAFSSPQRCSVPGNSVHR